MKAYVTFGQKHVHSINNILFDKDCVAVIECKNYGEGREIAFAVFGPKWCFCYPEENFEKAHHMKYYPRGLINVN